MTAVSKDVTAAAREELTEPSRTRVIGAGEPRFELYHFGFSICSQKVRAQLAEKGATYRAHELEPTENYRPNYVRLRLAAAGRDLSQRLATAHTMRTSVETEGFDACVVPTLVDLKTGQAVVDSAAILDYVEQALSTPPLVPAAPDASAAVHEQIRINDGIPHPGILYGFHADDRRPAFWREAMEGVYDRKCAVLERLIDEHHDDAVLVRAYRAKIAKEQAGKKVQKDPAYMAAILDEFRTLMAALDARLTAHGQAWVCGETFTLADCVWGVSLYRMHWLGHADLWDPHSAVRAYAERLYMRPSVRCAVIDWPTAMPASPHTADIGA